MCVNGRPYASELKKWTESEVRVLRRDKELLNRAVTDAAFFLPDTPSVTEYANHLVDAVEKLDEIIEEVGNRDEGES